MQSLCLLRQGENNRGQCRRGIARETPVRDDDGLNPPDSKRMGTLSRPRLNTGLETESSHLQCLDTASNFLKIQKDSKINNELLKP